MAAEKTSDAEAPAPAAAAVTKPPNGGAIAWLQVLGAFLLYMNTWGLLSSYGTLQTYYETELLTSSTAFQISVIGALQSFLLVFLGFLAGPIYDSGYFRHLLVAGSTLISAGTLAQSFCTQLWHFVIAEGACVGIGCGCLGVLSVAVPAAWFTTKLPMANGIAASGSGVGGIVYPIFIRQLIPSIGFGWTIRAMALTVAVGLGLAILVLRDPQSATKPKIQVEAGPSLVQAQPIRRSRRKLIHKESLVDGPYVAIVIAWFFVFLGLYTPWFNVQTFAITKAGMAPDLAFYIVMTMNIASIPGRIIPALLAPRLGPINLMMAAVLGLSVVGFAFLGITSDGGPGSSDVSIYAVATIYGFLTGSFFGVQPTVMVRVSSNNMSVLGTRFGMAFTVLSLALLFGTPIGGQLVDQYGYYAAWTWVGVTLFTGMVGIATTRTMVGKTNFVV